MPYVYHTISHIFTLYTWVYLFGPVLNVIVTVEDSKLITTTQTAKKPKGSLQNKQKGTFCKFKINLIEFPYN